MGPEALGNRAARLRGVRGGTMFPDDQGDNYDRNPTEGWAEAYRVSAGQNPTDWSIVSDIFRPDAATQRSRCSTRPTLGQAHPSAPRAASF